MNNSRNSAKSRRGVSFGGRRPNLRPKRKNTSSSASSFGTRSRRRSGNKQNFSKGRNRFGGYKRGGGRPGRNRFRGDTISYDKFINKDPKVRSQQEYVPKHTFAEFGFDSGIEESLKKNGYKLPTQIQDESIPHILAGKDVIGLSNTGSGKTAAFVLPIIENLVRRKIMGGVLIITPTRELAQQIQVEFRRFVPNKERLYSTLCVGGLNIRAQIRDIRRGTDVIIGTPGRLKDLMRRGDLDLSKTTTLVLDEVDRMLDMGFLPEIKTIIEKLPPKKQSLCFSATMSPNISKLLDSMLSNPVTISVRTSETGEHIAQDIIRAVSKEEKMKELLDMLTQDHFEKVLIFGQMKHGVQKLANELTEMGFASVAIHGNKSQPQRQRALNDFKTGKVNILVATDVAARGLDIPNVSHVINFDQPATHEDYVHRIGRTGRAGKPGQAYTFVK